MISRLKEMTSYMKAAPWPYLTGLGSLMLATGLAVEGFTFLITKNLAEATILGCWGGGWLVVALFSMADGISRYREYKRIKAMFNKYGYSERILALLSRSRCQRDAALLAARETGHSQNAQAYFAKRGYRWYHILPDSMIQNPFSFLKPSFLRSSFFPGKKVRA